MPSGDEEIDGRIVEVSGKYELHVRDDRGFMDDVTLHRGTIITPAGLTLKPGMVVRIAGVAAGKTFAADLIVTPFVATRPHAGFSLDDCAGASNAGPNPRRHPGRRGRCPAYRPHPPAADGAGEISTALRRTLASRAMCALVAAHPTNVSGKRCANV